MISLLIALPLCMANFHVPHDDVHGVATAHLPNGVVETVITTSRDSQVLRTRDEGLSWEPVFGGGLEVTRADVVVWDPHPAAHRFIIGTESGIWTYDPISGVVESFNDGLPPSVASQYACQITIPAEGTDGPVFMVNKIGQVWGLDHNSPEWVLVFDTGVLDPRAQIAVVPNFDANAPAGGSRAVAAAFAGMLFLSDDGGQSWAMHPQFSTQATQLDDRLITAISFADDFVTSGNMVVATSVPELLSFSGDQGTLWRSSDTGASFTPVAQYNSSVRAITSTPVGPSGNQWFVASVLAHPHFNHLNLSVGILRSSDGGQTWDDYGSAQDFVQEIDSASTVSQNRALIQDFEVSTDFATTGKIIFGRTEGLYVSNNEGLQWIQRAYRPASQIRGLDSFVDTSGNLTAFAGGYGTGTMKQDIASGDITMMSDGPNNYVHVVKLSPNFNNDGMMIVGGSRGPSFWYDPELGAANPHNALGWKAVPLDLHLGYLRGLAFSPNYDARGLPGSDQVFFFSTSSEAITNFVTRDGGRSVERLDKLTDGKNAPYMRFMSVAPSFDSGITTGPLDVYGAKGVNLYRLNGSRWEIIHSFRAKIKGMTVASDFDRDPLTPGLPRIFVALQAAPFFGEFIDDFDTPVANDYPIGLGDGFPIAIACPPDFGTTPYVYLATFSSGVKRLDLSQPSPQWINVGIDFPNYWLRTISLSPNFAVDRTIMAGSSGGVIKGQDLPGAPWQIKTPPTVRDNEGPEFHYYEPGRAANPDPSRTWPWDKADTLALRNTSTLSFVDATVSYTNNDGSYFDCAEYAGGIQLHTFRGADCGRVVVSVENYWTGTPVANTTVDLSASSWKNKTIFLNFPVQAVRIRVEADLDPGKQFYFDGMTFLPQ